ncbi:hypothetical protein BgiBS90_028927 [Biomphalaria glabrata]|nr:hypothetical protein BgiBS90_028927 [Biomphalaria glabrata]
MRESTNRDITQTSINRGYKRIFGTLSSVVCCCGIISNICVLFTFRYYYAESIFFESHPVHFRGKEIKELPTAESQGYLFTTCGQVNKGDYSIGVIIVVLIPPSRDIYFGKLCS